MQWGCCIQYGKYVCRQQHFCGAVAEGVRAMLMPVMRRDCRQTGHKVDANAHTKIPTFTPTYAHTLPQPPCPPPHTRKQRCLLTSIRVMPTHTANPRGVIASTKRQGWADPSKHLNFPTIHRVRNPRPEVVQEVCPACTHE